MFNSIDNYCYSVYFNYPRWPIKGSYEFTPIDNLVDFKNDRKIVVDYVDLKVPKLGFFSRNGKNFFIYKGKIDKDKSELKLYTQELGKDMKPYGSPRELTSFPRNKKFYDDVKIVWSVNKKYFLVYKADGEQLLCKVFDNNLTEQWSMPIGAAGKRGSYNINKVLLSDKGEFFATGHYLTQGNNDPFFISHSKFKISPVVYDISNSNEVNFEYTVFLSSSGEPIIAGLYLNDNQKLGYKILRLTNDASLVEYSSGILSDKYNAIANKGYEPKFFAVENLIEMSNKDVVLSIEGSMKAYIKHESNSTYYSSPVYLVSVRPDKSEKWNKIIFKSQMQPLRNDHLGHVLFYKGNNVYLVYNDNLKNSVIPPDVDVEREGLIKRSLYVSTVEIDEKGNAKKLLLVKSKHGLEASFRKK